MTAAVSLWTLASVAHACAFGLRGFAAARTLLGCGEGATFPGALRTVVQTLPPGYFALLGSVDDETLTTHPQPPLPPPVEIE